MFPLKTASAQLQIPNSAPVKILISKGSDYYLIMITQNSKLGNFSWSDPFTSLMGDSKRSLLNQIYSTQLSLTLNSPCLLCLSLDNSLNQELEDLETHGNLLKEICCKVSTLIKENF